MREELDRLGERIAEQAAHVDAAMHRLLTDIRAFDEAKGYAMQGFASCAHWLSWRAGWTPGIARERVRVARRLGTLPAIDDELRRGAVSFSKVRAMTRVAEPAIEQALIEYARHATAAQLESICRKFQLVQAAAKQDPAQRAARRRLTMRTLDDGMVRIEAVVRPEEAAQIWAAIERAAADVPAATPELVDGLVAIAQDYARGGATERVPVELVVTVPLASVAGVSDEPGELAGGTFVSAATARRLACDAGVVRKVGRAARRECSARVRLRLLPWTRARHGVDRCVGDAAGAIPPQYPRASVAMLFGFHTTRDPDPEWRVPAETLRRSSSSSRDGLVSSGSPDPG